MTEKKRNPQHNGALFFDSLEGHVDLSKGNVRANSVISS